MVRTWQGKKKKKTCFHALSYIDSAIKISSTSEFLEGKDIMGVVGRGRRDLVEILIMFLWNIFGLRRRFRFPQPPFTRIKKLYGSVREKAGSLQCQHSLCLPSSPQAAFSLKTVRVISAIWCLKYLWSEDWISSRLICNARFWGVKKKGGRGGVCTFNVGLNFFERAEKYWV